jgi:hypothetical protein
LVSIIIANISILIGGFDGKKKKKKCVAYLTQKFRKLLK